MLGCGGSKDEITEKWKVQTCFLVITKSSLYTLLVVGLGCTVYHCGFLLAGPDAESTTTTSLRGAVLRYSAGIVKGSMGQGARTAASARGIRDGILLVLLLSYVGTS